MKKIVDFYLDNLMILNVIIGMLMVLMTIVFIIFRKKIIEIYHKYEEIINYVIIGATTTLVSVVSYFILRNILTSLYLNTILSWIIAVFYAYITNRIFVFKSKSTKVFKEIVDFVSCRLLTLLLELGLMALLVKAIRLHDGIAKILVQFIIFITNYFLSKLIVFKKK